MIKFNNVSYTYPTGNACITNLNLHIKQGEFIVLCGKSGCGKTTVTRIINKLIPFFYEGKLTGEVLIKGQDIKEESISDMVSICGSVFQNPKSQFFNMETDGELAFGCENLQLSKEEILARMERTIKILNLEKLMKRSVFELSGGEKQQIACGSIYATNPEIYVFDEPSSNLDTMAIKRLANVLMMLKQQGKTVIIAEHRLHFLLDLADRFLYFDNGHLAQEYTSEKLKALSPKDLSSLGLRTINLNNLQFIKKDSPIENETVISIKNLIYKRKKSNILDIKNLNIPKNSILAIIGHNGAGKTTLAQVMCGFIKAKGTIEFAGKALKPKQRILKSYMVMQDVNRQLFCESVLKEVQLGAVNQQEEYIVDLLNSMNLEMFKDRHPASLSGGQKQRVAICASIAAQKDIVIFDEPTSGLDYIGMKNLCDLISNTANNNLANLIITHDLELILGCCTHVLEINKKEIYPLDDKGINVLRTYLESSL